MKNIDYSIKLLEAIDKSMERTINALDKINNPKKKKIKFKGFWKIINKSN